MKISLIKIKKTIFSFLICMFFISSSFARDEIFVDKIFIEKSVRKMYLLNKDKKVREYDIALGFAPEGAKEKQGDGKTPEGIYKISGRNPGSSYHKSLKIDYPSKKDLDNAKKNGVEDVGSDIMIHGLPNGQSVVGKAHLQSDWTLGCIAVTSE